MSEETIVKILDSLLIGSARRYSEEEKLRLLSTWNLSLTGLSKEQLERGFSKVIQSPSKFMIDCGSFRELCLTDFGSRSVEDEAAEIWDSVRRNLNAYISPCFKNSVISEAIRKMGGWVKLSTGEVVNEPFRRTEFIGLYCMFKRRGNEYEPLLTGIFTDIKMIGYEPGEEKEALVDISKGILAKNKIKAML